MIDEEAIQIFRECEEFMHRPENILAIQALESRIPKERIQLYEPGHYISKCPTCGYLIYRNQKFCDGCGQAIGWKNEEKDITK